MHRLFALALLLGSVMLSAAVPDIQVQELGHLGGSPFFVGVVGFGRSGTVAGVTHKPGVGIVPFAWTAASGFQVIAEEEGLAMAANRLGQVTGSLGMEGFLWSPSGTRIAINSPLAYSVSPRVINDAGQVAGEMELTNGERHAFIWSAADGLKDIGWLGGWGLTVSDITENGMVVGTADLPDGNEHAFMWKHGPMKDLGTLGGDRSGAYAANEDGMIVGNSSTADYLGRAFLYHRGKMSALATPTRETGAYAINAAGMVAGWGRDWGAPETAALVWSPDGTTEFITGANFAVDVNDAGQVAAHGGTGYNQKPRAYLWSHDTGLMDHDSEHDASSQPLGVTDDGRLVSQRKDWSDVNKVFVWKPGEERQLLDGLGGGWSRALLVNANGQVAGLSRTVLGYDRAFLWTPGPNGGTRREIPAPAGAHSKPVALNATGQVAGETYRISGHTLTSGASFFWPGSGTAYSDLGQVNVVDLNDPGQVLGYSFLQFSFVWSAGTFTYLPPLGTIDQDAPTDINNKGQVVGYFWPDYWGVHAFSWTPGTAPVDLGTLGGTYSAAVAVNDAGQIAGNSTLADGTTHAFKTTAGRRLTDLGLLFGSGDSQASAMNEKGHIVGTSTDHTLYHAFLYDTRMRDIGEVGGSDMLPFRINLSKDVIGMRWQEDTQTQAFFRAAGGSMITLGAPDSERSLVFSINDRGEIAGSVEMPDGQQRAILWRTR